MVTVTANLTPEKFLKNAGPWLEREGAKNNVILGIASNLLQKPPNQRQEHYFWLVKQDGGVAGAVVWTPPYKLTLTEMPPEALTALARKIQKSSPAIPGVQGPPEMLPSFIRAWNAPGVQAVLETSLRLYQLKKLEPIPSVPGHLRAAGPSDMEWITQWCRQFREEIRAPEKIDERELMGGYIREQRAFIWDNGQACAIAGFGGETDHGARINMVYTPRSLRKRGYASNLVASLSQRLLDSGKRYCVLYADLLNPTSNHIYQKMGYQAVSDWEGYVFQDFKSL